VSYDKATFRSAIHIDEHKRGTNYRIKTEECEEKERRERQTTGGKKKGTAKNVICIYK